MDLDHGTGGAVDGWDHVAQSVATILSTRLNSRAFRREFGSDVPALTDAPLNPSGILNLNVAVAEAIARWEPRFELTNVGIEPNAKGVVNLVLVGNYRPEAHRGDFSKVEGTARTIRVMRDRVEQWSLTS